MEEKNDDETYDNNNTNNDDFNSYIDSRISNISNIIDYSSTKCFRKCSLNSPASSRHVIIKQPILLINNATTNTIINIITSDE